MRKLIAVIFLIIFTFQVIPVKVLGSLLAKGQTEEEAKTDCSDDACGKVLKYDDLISCSSSGFDLGRCEVPVTGFSVHRSDDIPVSYAAEILSPPPNC